jgi:hypothetical protein
MNQQQLIAEASTKLLGGAAIAIADSRIPAATEPTPLRFNLLRIFIAVSPLYWM